jgi:hypothetical protein
MNTEAVTRTGDSKVVSLSQVLVLKRQAFVAGRADEVAHARVAWLVRQRYNVARAKPPINPLHCRCNLLRFTLEPQNNVLLPVFILILSPTIVRPHSWLETRSRF